MTSNPPHDAAFAKYDEAGAYHWREISKHWLHHNAFTAERYRRTIATAQPLGRQRVLDYGCGDGALLGLISRNVGPGGEAHGFDPNPKALELAGQLLATHRLKASLHSETASLADASFDRVICADVIEHVRDVAGLVTQIDRLLRPGGLAVITSPVRLTKTPEDQNHVQEWFPEEFVALFANGPLRVVRHEEFIPAAAPEVYFWRPPTFLRFPVFRLLCNLLSIYGNVNALSWLRLRPRLFMAQMALLEKPL